MSGYRLISYSPFWAMRMRGVKLTRHRLSLSNNHIFQIPYRFADCFHLRYLNIRANNFREFPKAVGHQPSYGRFWLILIPHTRCTNCHSWKSWILAGIKSNACLPSQGLWSTYEWVLILRVLLSPKVVSGVFDLPE